MSDTAHSHHGHDHAHRHDHDHGHAHLDLTVHGALLTSRERRSMTLRLLVALITGGLLCLALGILVLFPDQAEVAHLIAGLAAVLIAIPVFAAARHALLCPSLHGITDLLVAAAVIAAFAVGDLEAAALVPLAMVIGHILEERSLMGSQEAIAALARLTRTSARLIEPGTVDHRVRETPSETLRPGDRIELRPGDRVPADGVIDVGSASLDTAPITGESVPSDVGPGSTIFAGAIVQGGRLEARVTRIGADTALGRVVALMREAERAKPPITRLLERFATPYLGLILLLATGVFLATGSSTAALTVLVAACPCALVLAAPATAIAGIAVAGRHGILVKGTAFLEELADVDCLIVDKTGTMTLGELRVVGVAPALSASAQHSADDPAARALRLAASLAAASSHPVSRALAAAVPAEQRLRIDNLREHSGNGLSGHCGGAHLALGRASFLATTLAATRTGDAAAGSAPATADGMPLSAATAHATAASAAAVSATDAAPASPSATAGSAAFSTLPEPPPHDGPVVGLISDGAFVAWILLADEARPEARVALADLRSQGLTRQILLTGDRRQVAERVAAHLGIDQVDAEVLPEQKLQRVLAETAAGHRPLVVGDGINDALALKAGAVGVAMGGLTADGRSAGTDAALASADLVLMSRDLRRLGTCLRLSRRCRRTITINVILGLTWTLAVLAGGIAGWYGPLAAALLHNLGTLAVMANAGRLLRLDETT